MRRLALLFALALLATMVAIPVAQAEVDTVPIGTIQGAGHISPYNNQEVTTTGVVTAVAFSGYYIQDPDGDGDPATS